jgi:hypothetical protein
LNIQSSLLATELSSWWIDLEVPLTVGGLDGTALFEGISAGCKGG